MAVYRVRSVEIWAVRSSFRRKGSGRVKSCLSRNAPLIAVELF